MMNQYDFLYAIGRLRVIEKNLFNAASMEQVLASDFRGALKLLYEKGFGSEGTPYERLLQNRLDQAWELLCRINPYQGCLDMLIIKNDFHNLKAAIKAFLSKNDGGDIFLTPCVYDPEEVKSRVFSKRFDQLPEPLRGAAERCYAELVANMDPQMADVIADGAALSFMQRLAEQTGETFLQDLGEWMAAMANIKTAARGARTKRSPAFFQEAIVPCATLHKEKLAKAAQGGFDAVLSYLGGTKEYRQAAHELSKSMSAFEKWSDDALMKLLMPAKHASFGIAPLAAYYLAVEAEVKNLRIVLSCKHHHVEDGMIRERMRLLYA